jgi:PPK2 family polyphosphate:nucleotide phosphotransferase
VSVKRIGRRGIPELLQVKPGSKPKLHDAQAARDYGWDREHCEQAIGENRARLEELQYKMFVDGRFALLVVLQAIDGGGKDSTIRRVFSAFSPQGCTVTSFKAPSSEELRHDYLWRVHQHTPQRGEIAVFNRSHYEDVLVVRVNNLVPPAVWTERYAQINQFEQLLTDCGTRVVKLFLHISKDEQKRRFQERIADRRKHWKFDPADLEKRKQWEEYRAAFEAMLAKCSTETAPWYLIPADRKAFRDLAVSQILLRELEQLPLRWPEPRYDPGKIRVT